MIICADDFGLAGDIDRAILDLADRNRISAVSSLVAAPASARATFSSLRERRERLDLGLHISLVGDPPLSPAAEVASLVREDGRCFPFRWLLLRSLAGRVRSDDATREIQRQYERFVDWFGQPPDFIDSHLHVHQFPGICAGLLRFLASLPGGDRPYVRNSWMPPAKIARQGVAVAKASSISVFGGVLRRQLEHAGVRTNTGFTGVYDYRRYRSFRRYLARFMACLEPGNAIVMTHPGLNDPWRRAEYEGLLASSLPQDRARRYGF